MSLFVPSTATNMPEWVRKVATALNLSVKRDGAATYAAPTAGASYSQAQVQALMDAVEALSDRLK